MEGQRNHGWGFVQRVIPLPQNTSYAKIGMSLCKISVCSVEHDADQMA